MPSYIITFTAKILIILIIAVVVERGNCFRGCAVSKVTITPDKDCYLPHDFLKFLSDFHLKYLFQFNLPNSFKCK